MQISAKGRNKRTVMLVLFPLYGVQNIDLGFMFMNMVSKFREQICNVMDISIGSNLNKNTLANKENKK